MRPEHSECIIMGSSKMCGRVSRSGTTEEKVGEGKEGNSRLTLLIFQMVDLLL